MNSNNPFTKFLGPLPGDVPAYKDPEGAAPLKQPDPELVARARAAVDTHMGHLFDQAMANLLGVGRKP